MLMRKSALEKSGLLDETFFMYGEDIDLSYRILLAGFRNFYFSETQIIHYKGESTKKGSLNYVYVFYNAMLIFAQKHFSTKKISLFFVLIRLAVALRAMASVLNSFFNLILSPIFKIKNFISRKQNNSRILIVAGKEETQRILQILNDSKIRYEFIGNISNEKMTSDIGNISQIEEITKKHKPDEIIFSFADFPAETIISTFEKLEKIWVQLKTVLPNSSVIIGGK